MVESPQNRMKSLRQSAEHCRALARVPLPVAVRREIEAFAAALDADARKLEGSLRSAGPPRKAVRGRA